MLDEGVSVGRLATKRLEEHHLENSWKQIALVGICHRSNLAQA
jgi:hypothetical protein